MDGHVVHALPGLRLDDLEQQLRGEIGHVAHVGHGLVDGHGAHRERAGAEDGLADLRDVAAGGEVHHRVGAVLEADAQLLELPLDVAHHRAVADVRVDLAGGPDADGDGVELRVGHVGRDDHPAPGDLAADELGVELLPRRDVGHLLGHQPLAGVVHLRDVRLTPALLDPIGPHLSTTSANEGTRR